MTSSSVSVRELPLFPLPELVLFPGQSLPLHIFEYRYRMMINTVLESDRMFGVLMWDSETGKPANIGCVAQILQYHRLPDDRFKILTLGQQRFRVLDYVRETPYRVGLVEWIEDEPSNDAPYLLATEVRELLNDVIRLSQKLTDQAIEMPKIPRSPIELSTGLPVIFKEQASNSSHCWKPVTLQRVCDVRRKYYPRLEVN